MHSNTTKAPIDRPKGRRQEHHPQISIAMSEQRKRQRAQKNARRAEKRRKS